MHNDRKNMLADLRFASRTFHRSPRLIAAAILATALEVGANAAIFSVIQAAPRSSGDSTRYSLPASPARRYCSRRWGCTACCRIR